MHFIILFIVNSSVWAANPFFLPDMTPPKRVCVETKTHEARLSSHSDFSCDGLNNLDKLNEDPYAPLTFLEAQNLHSELKMIFRKKDFREAFSSPADKAVLEKVSKSGIKNGLPPQDQEFFEQPQSGQTAPLVWDSYENNFYFVTKPINEELKSAEAYVAGVLHEIADGMIPFTVKEGGEQYAKSAERIKQVADKYNLLKNAFLVECRKPAPPDEELSK